MGSQPESWSSAKQARWQIFALACVAVLILGVCIASRWEEDPSPHADSYSSPAPVVATDTTEAAAPAADWTQIASWSGSGIKSTEKFTVGDEWKIAWDTYPGQYGDGVFQIYIYRASGDVAGVAANVMGASHDETIQHEGGTFYLQFNGSQSFSATVSDRR